MDNTIAFYRERFGLQDATFSRIEHADAIVATVYKIISPSGLELILKICEQAHHYRREVYFLKVLANKVPVPRIIQLVEPETNVHGAILMECLPGRLLKMGDLTEPLGLEMGSLLARIHLNSAPGYGDLIKPESLSSDPRIPFTEKFEESLAECQENLPKILIDQCRHYYESHTHLLNFADGPCIVHRDFRLGNLMIFKGKIQGIIDWSSARASFSQEDFCSLNLETLPPFIKSSFLVGYASIRPLLVTTK